MGSIAPSQRMRILITGASGFIGQALAKELLSSPSMAGLTLTDVSKPPVPSTSGTCSIDALAADLTDASSWQRLVAGQLTHVYLLHGVMSGAAEANLELGATLQATAMLYLALYLRFAHPDANGQGGTSAGGIVGVVFIYIYAFGWSFGHSVACYVVAAEIFPTRIRSFCMSICFFINWIVDYGITRATPNMLSTLGWGTFLLYAALTYLGVVFVYFCMPETKGRSIESMDDLFQHPLWMMWKYAYPRGEEDKVRHDIKEAVDGEHTEDVPEGKEASVQSKHV